MFEHIEPTKIREIPGLKPIIEVADANKCAILNAYKMGKTLLGLTVKTQAGNVISVEVRPETVHKGGRLLEKKLTVN